MLVQMRILVAALASAFAVGACTQAESTKTIVSPQAASAPAATVNGRVAAMVNGMPIGEDFVKLVMQQRGDLDTPEARKKVIDSLAVQLLTSQEAIKKGLDQRPDIVARVDLNKQSLLATAFVQDYLKSNPVGDDLINAEYERLKSQSHGIEFKARHIMVEKETEANEIIAALKKNPKAFDALARQKSRDSITSQSGGDLGWFEPRGRDPDLENAVASLEKGKFTEKPVRSHFGFHIVLLEDKRPKAPPPMEQLKAQLRHQLEQEKLQKFLDEMKAKAKIEISAS